MTDDAPLQPSAPTDTQLVEDVNGAADYLLSGLISMINRSGDTEIGVTLTVGGNLVSGILISGRAYGELVAAQLRAAPGGAAFAAIGDVVAENYRDDEITPGTERSDDDSERGRVSFLHMRNTTLHSPGAAAELGMGLWRGRLSTVAGWTMGTIGPKSGFKPRATNES